MYQAILEMISIRTWLIAALAASSLGACAKTVQWEEDVPLNTGETVRVARSVEYTLQGGAGNPLDLGWRPDSRTARLSFQWGGRTWRFDAHGGPLLLAIGPDRRPALLALAEAGAWDARHRYACTVPFYVQFVPDDSGQRWRWPPAVDPFFFEMRANLLQDIPTPDKNAGSYPAAAVRATNDRVLQRYPSRQRIDPNYTGDTCRHLRRK